MNTKPGEKNLSASKRAVQALAGRSFGTNPDRLELEDLPASDPLCVRCADQEPGSPPLPTECTCGKTVTSDTIVAELRNARMLVNRGHGDVSDEPDPLHEAAADEIERLDRELEAREKTIERLRQELEVLRLIYPEGTADKITFLELDNKRLRTLLRRARQALRSLDEISDEEIGALVCKLECPTCSGVGVSANEPQACTDCLGTGTI
jgi:hypothetical protein